MRGNRGGMVIFTLLFLCCEFLIVASVSPGEAAVVRVLVVKIYLCWSPVVLCAVKFRVAEQHRKI